MQVQKTNSIVVNKIKIKLNERYEMKLEIELTS